MFFAGFPCFGDEKLTWKSKEGCGCGNSPLCTLCHIRQHKPSKKSWQLWPAFLRSFPLPHLDTCHTLEQRSVSWDVRRAARKTAWFVLQKGDIWQIWCAESLGASFACVRIDIGVCTPIVIRIAVRVGTVVRPDISAIASVVAANMHVGVSHCGD